MAIPSGLASQVGYKSETAVGTAVTVDKFDSFLGFDMKNDVSFLPVMGIQAGRRTQRLKKKGQQKITGTLKGELNNKPLATWLTHMFGTVNTSGAGPYTHTATPGSLTGKSLTIQAGYPDAAGTVNPITFAGCKVPSWTIGASVNQICTFDRSIVAMTENATGTPALTTASFLSGVSPFVFTEASITAGGASLGVISDFTLTGDNGLNVDRFGLGSGTTAEPLESNYRAYTGTLNVEFASQVAYNQYLAGTDFALVFTFVSGADTLTITTNAYYTGTTPAVDGPVMLKQSLPFVCESSTSDAGCITAVLVNADVVAT